uniref:TPR_REGION domain-containing protein n=1 Tax=Panagrellus redivivus TaxID=6233 RepID=A0A7E4ZR85_PANRE
MQRFIDRLYTKNLDNLQLKMLVANNALGSGSYKTAIYLYNQVDQTYPNTLAKLSLGVAFVGLACKKTSSDRIPLGVRALAKFTEYMHAREAEGLGQEAYYNIGRMFHGLGFFTQAVYWYERCLKTPDPVVYRNGVPLPGDTYSMKPLAALNYIDIIKKNNPLRARQLRKTFCVL